MRSNPVSTGSKDLLTPTSLTLILINGSLSFPPIYGRSGSGILTEPSALKIILQKSNQHTGEALPQYYLTCGQNICRPWPFTRIFSLLAWRRQDWSDFPPQNISAVSETMPPHQLISPSDLLKSPEQHSSVLTGTSKERNKSTVFCQSLSNHILLSSGLHTTIISCFSN